MNLQLITDTKTLIDCQSNWNRVAQQRPFMRWEWQVNWLLHKVENVSPSVLVSVDGDNQWTGIAPFCLEDNRLTRKLCLLGAGKTCTDYAGLIVGSEHQKEFTESVVDWLSQNLNPLGPLGTIDSVELEGVAPSCAATQYFGDLLGASGFNAHTVELEGCWVTGLPKSWDELNASFSKSLRRKTKKAVTRLLDIDTEIYSTDEHDLSKLWPTFVDLHQKRRQMLDQPGCFADEHFAKFLKSAVGDLVDNGLAELVVINYQDQPLASFVLLNDGETTYMYQSGMNPENIALEPGYQIAVLAMQRSIEKGFGHFDFLRGDEPYKSRWKTERVPLVCIRFIPRKFSSQLKYEIWRTGKSIRGYLGKSNPSD